jgi:hypothetical protein
MMFWYGGDWARGEIDAEEYQRLRDLLDGDSRRNPAGSGSGR